MLNGWRRAFCLFVYVCVFWVRIILGVFICVFLCLGKSDAHPGVSLNIPLMRKQLRQFMYIARVCIASV